MTDPVERARGIFREEAVERLDRMVEILLALEAGQPPPDATAALFRDAHSLKGGAGLLQLDDLHTVADAVEDVLSDARAAQAGVPPDLFDPLLKATDAMRRALAGEPFDAAAVLVELGAGTEEEPQALLPVPAQAAPTAAVASTGQSLRVAAEKVDRLLETVGEAVLYQRGLEHLLDAADDMSIGEALDRGELLIDELQHAALELRAMPLATIVGPFPRFVRDLASAEGKEAELAMTGVETQLDRAILEGITEPLLHILRNAIAHGIEPPPERARAGKPARGRIALHAEQRGSMVAIEVADDGAGVPAELLREAGASALIELLARPGFSTAERVTGVAGRGVGLDAVKSHIEALGGELEARSETGRGMAITVVLPLTLAILHVLLVERGGGVLALPVSSIAEVLVADRVVTLGERPAIEWRGRALPLVDLAAALGAPPAELPSRPPALIVAHSGHTVAFVCDRLRGESMGIVKSLGPVLGALAGYLGGAILPEGRIALVVDPAVAVARAPGASRQPPAAPRARAPRKVLVVDDQFTIRELQRSILEAAGFSVTTATDGRDAFQQLGADADIGIVVTDLEMPEMDGLELLRRIREAPQLSSLPVVVLTSLAGEQDRRRGLEAGADAYVTKDRFDQRVLLETVERLVGR
jgi:two-component system, chemotaxis family, sensor kinase CheA